MVVTCSRYVLPSTGPNNDLLGKSVGHRNIWIRFCSFQYFVISKHSLALSEIIKSIRPPQRLRLYERGNRIDIYNIYLFSYIYKGKYSGERKVKNKESHFGK